MERSSATPNIDAILGSAPTPHLDALLATDSAPAAPTAAVNPPPAAPTAAPAAAQRYDRFGEFMGVRNVNAIVATFYASRPASADPLVFGLIVTPNGANEYRPGHTFVSADSLRARRLFVRRPGTSKLVYIEIDAERSDVNFATGTVRLPWVPLETQQGAFPGARAARAAARAAAGASSAAVTPPPAAPTTEPPATDASADAATDSANVPTDEPLSADVAAAADDAVAALIAERADATPTDAADASGDVNPPVGPADASDSATGPADASSAIPTDEPTADAATDPSDSAPTDDAADAKPARKRRTGGRPAARRKKGAPADASDASDV